QLTDVQRSRPSLSEELDRERSGFLARQSLAKDAESALRTRKEVLTGILSLLPALDSFPKLVAALEGLGIDEAAKLKDVLAGFSKFVADTRATATATAAGDTGTLITGLQGQLEELNARYYALRQD